MCIIPQITPTSNHLSKMLKLALVASLLVLQVLGSPVKVPQSLEHSLKVKGKVDVFLSLQSTSSVLSQLKTAKLATRAARKSLVANSLKSFAKESQASVLSFLAAQSDITVKGFWISNEVYVKNADTELISKLAQRSDILGIREELKEKLPIEATFTPSKRFQGEVEWGVEKIGTEAVWQQGINGTGVLAAIMDSGVRVTHEALRDSYVGEYGWFAPLEKTETPVDLNGHGTHVMGTILGQGGIGVAPGAKWMACSNIPGGEAEDIACGEFFACPHLPDGSAPDCTRAPDFVSNSWGYYGGNNFFDKVFDAWEAAGIVPIFSAGNNGPSCSSCGSPGDSGHPALITVGSTDVNDELSYFSSFGPSPFNDKIKPDIAAPGSDVRSSCIDSDTAYCLKSGTSMASPHVAGVVALIRSAEPTASVEDVAQSIYLGATKTVASTGSNCGGVSEGVYPNNHVGNGRLSASGSIATIRRK